MIGYRNQVLAAKAWHEVKHCYGNRRNLRDFKAGFMQGYIDVANGSNGCVPSVAPASYWGWRYQSADGQNAVNAWFAGYPLGAQRAEEDGVGHWSNIRPSGAHVPQQRQAVYVPPPVPSSEDATIGNPFYDNQSVDERYPYEPVQDDAANAESDSDVDENIDSPADADDMELQDAPAAPKDISDAIREALDAPLDNDSTSTATEVPAVVSTPYVEPPYEPALDEQPWPSNEENGKSVPDMPEVIRPKSPAMQTAEANSELRFTFE